MKAKIFTLITLCAMCFGTTKAQLYLEDNFNYTAGAFVQNPVASTQNLQTNGWSTQTSTGSINNSWNIVNPGLTYPDYYTETGTGSALMFVGNALGTGQSLYQSWKHAIVQDSTIYISFLVNFAPGQAANLSPDFFFGIKSSGSFSDTNWGACIYAAYDPALVGTEVNLGIKKISSGIGTYATSNIAANTTHLFVLKYKCGKIGASAAAEVGNFDDQMSLFVNPSTTTGEPATPTLYNNDATSKDMARWGSTKIFGGLVAAYLRFPGTGLVTSLYTIDALRIGLTWNDVVSVKTGLRSTTADNFRYTMNDSKQLTVYSSNYTTYDVVSLSGQRMMAGSLKSQAENIDATSLKSGVYILNVHGLENASCKFVVK
jgi:hypothetical protein